MTSESNHPSSSPSIKAGLHLSVYAMAVNFVLATVKIVVGFLGNSYALIADGVESAADIFSSLVVWGGLRLSIKPADEKHPYGHGKAESIAAGIVSVTLLGAALLIAMGSLHQILHPKQTPRWFTLIVLVLVVIIKEILFRKILTAGRTLESSALKVDALHHRLDALTSAAAFIGISIALIGGHGFESADGWAALVACLVITWNGLQLLYGALNELMDATPSPRIADKIREIASGIKGVLAIEKCRVRKSGLFLSIDVHVQVDGEMTVHDGHEIAHRVKDCLLASKLRINDVTVHIEPYLG